MMTFSVCVSPALYSEPRLSIQVNGSSVSVVYETEGYPEAQVQWEDSAGQQLVHQTQVSPLQEGLLFLRTQIVPLENSKHTFNLTFILKNQHVQQTLERVVTLNHGESLSISLYTLCLRHETLSLSSIVFGYEPRAGTKHKEDDCLVTLVTLILL